MELTKKLIPQWVELEYNGEKIAFLCSPLTASQIITARSLVESPATIGEGLMTSARYSVRDWRGITVDGAPIVFSAQALEEFFTGPLLAGLLLQLGAEIINRSKLTEPERKN